MQRAFICLSSFRSPHLLLPPLPRFSPLDHPRVPPTTMPTSRDLPDRDPLSAALRPPIDETEEEKASRVAEEEAAKRVSHAIDESIRLEKQQRKKHKLVRLLLLGQSESGPFPLRRVSMPHINCSLFSQANLLPYVVSHFSPPPTRGKLVVVRPLANTSRGLAAPHLCKSSHLLFVFYEPDDRPAHLPANVDGPHRSTAFLPSVLQPAARICVTRRAVPC